MITVNLDKMLWERHMKLSELSEKIGISLTNLSLLRKNRHFPYQPFPAQNRERACNPLHYA